MAHLPGPPAPCSCRPPALDRPDYRRDVSDDGRQRARELAREALAAGDAVGWFERLYAEADCGTAVVPWADLRPNPHLISWLETWSIDGPCLVVGCGLGDDAAWLAENGFGPVVAFDVSATAVEHARQRFGECVQFQVANLFDLPDTWNGRFGFVLEAYTLQVLPAASRMRASDAIAATLRPGGTLLVIARGRDDDEASGAMPWPLTSSDLHAFEAAGLRSVSWEDYYDPEEPDVRRFRAAFDRRIERH